MQGHTHELHGKQGFGDKQAQTRLKEFLWEDFGINILVRKEIFYESGNKKDLISSVLSNKYDNEPL